MRWTSIPSRGGVEILLVTLCYRNRDKLRPDEPLGLYVDFTFYLPNSHTFEFHPFTTDTFIQQIYFFVKKIVIEIPVMLYFNFI